MELQDEEHMKTLRSFLSVIFMVALLGIAHQLNGSPIKHINFSLWSEYKKVDFEGLSQDEKTAKLQSLYQDMCTFAQQHGIRRVIVRILDPMSYDFFNPENFDSNRDDNFYYWALQLSTRAEIEALLDPSAFQVAPQSITEKIYGFYDYYFGGDKGYGNFLNLPEKLHWVTIVNDMFDPQSNRGLLIKGITIDPKGEKAGVCQNLVNALDQYKSATNPLLPDNRHFNIRRGILISIDQKDFAFANLALFPLKTDLRGEKPNNIGVNVPENFPSEGPEYFAPSWRENQNYPLLETVYVRMFDPRLVECIYQNHEVLPDPMTWNSNAIATLSKYLGNTFRGAPFMKGPGYLYAARGLTKIEGLFTFFRTGGGQYNEGQFLDGSRLEVTLPDGRKVEKVISGDPQNNRLMKTTSPFSTTHDLVKAEYSLAPIPINWSYPQISSRVHSNIYFVFSTDFQPKQGRYFGNWNINNFVNLLYYSKARKGFLYEPFFSTFGKNCCWNPKNNLVIYDFTTIPNGYPYPEFDWELGNGTY